MSTYKDLLDSIKCGKSPSVVFTEDDLAKVKSCLPPNVSPPTREIKLTSPTQSTCINEGLDQVKSIVTEQLNKQALVIELATVRGKIEEALDHYSFILRYYSTRVKFFNDTLSTVEPFTSEYLYWSGEVERFTKLEKESFSKITSIFSITSTSSVTAISEYNALTNLSDTVFLTIKSDLSNLFSVLPNTVAVRLQSNSDFKEYYQYRINRIKAQEAAYLAKTGATKALSDKIQNLNHLPTGTVTSITGTGLFNRSILVDSSARIELQSVTDQFSGQLAPIFGNGQQSTGGILVPARVAAFSVKLIGLDSLNISTTKINPDNTSSVVQKDIKIRENLNLSAKPFNSILSLFCTSVVPDSDPKNHSNYDNVVGNLYNGIDKTYLGLYRKLKNPIYYLYSPEERGLSVDKNQIDPKLKSVKDAPTTVTDEQTTFYISSQDTYSAFYEGLEKSLPDRIKQEKEVNFPKQIVKTITEFEKFAMREVADQFRRVNDAPIKLARVTNYTAGASTIYTQGKFEYNKLDQALSSALAYYTKAESELNSLILVCTEQISKLTDLINQNSLSEKVLTDKIGSIACFKDAINAKPSTNDCEAATMAKLGKDPLFIRTLNGTDAALPDMNTPCYWREFTNALNKVSILPIPDITAPIFRYYPINNLIPTPLGIILIPIPQKWKTLFVLSTPLGTLVMFLVMPIAIVGIPLPSVYAMYLAPDGRKYMIFAPNIPVLYGNPLLAPKYGFEPNFSAASANPTGLASPFSGNLVKGALSLPLSVQAGISKASRLTKIAATLALGQQLTITSRSGEALGGIEIGQYTNLYTSTYEKMLTGANSSGGDIDRQVAKFKKWMNLQFDRLGPVQIPSISQLKEKTRATREGQVLKAEAEEDSPKRRKAKDIARNLDPLTLENKVTGLLSDFNAYIDKIKLGTIVFPDNPTKLNPKAPPAITGLMAIIEQASTGGLTIDSNSTSFISRLKKHAAEINVKDITGSQDSYNLNNKEDLEKFKQAIKNYSKKAVDYFSGIASPYDTIPPGATEDQKKAIAASNQKRKERLKTALAFTSLSVAVPSLKLFDPGAPCCAVPESKINLSTSPQSIAAIAVFNTLFEAYVNGITADDISKLLGEEVSNIGVSTISVLFNSLANTIPSISLPEKPDLSSISQAILAPILTAITIPQAPNPLGIPFPIQIPIPLDALIKPLLKASIAYLLELLLRLLSDAGNMLSSNSEGNGNTTYEEIVKQIPCGAGEFARVATTTKSNHVSITLPNGFQLKLPKIPTIPLDIVAYFSLLTGTDLTELIRNLLNAAIDGILVPIKSVLEPLVSILTSLKGLSYNILEAANPLISIIKLIIMAIELQIPDATKMKIANLDAINALKAAYIPVVTAAEPVLKEVAYLGAIISSAMAGGAGVQIARIAASPFFNQDDLPPWERLTHKNPLFAIFLDEIAWRSTLTSTGSLLFQTKMPGLYPVAWAPSIFIDIGALYHPPN